MSTPARWVAGDIPRNTAAQVIESLERVDGDVDPGLGVHLILDNGQLHVVKATEIFS